MGVYLALTITDVQMAQRCAYSGWKFDIFLVDLRERVVLIATQIVSDRLACEDHEDVSSIFGVNDIQNRTNDLNRG